MVTAKEYKTANMLNKLQESMGPAAKADPRALWQAEIRAAAETAIHTFAETRGANCDKTVAGPIEDRDARLAFLGVPAEHRDRRRMADPIESVFATVRHRIVRTEGALSQTTARFPVFTLLRAASRKWRRLQGASRLPLVVERIELTDAETRAARSGRATQNQAWLAFR